ncbi:MAG: 4Fe-4S binding protein [Actinobacteria bacterium]|jgi:pyruvate ferredoxin oxidoreductase delta subunit|nr:4Fe-4S binding protein [Actinomycetota bacterium]
MTPPKKQPAVKAVPSTPKVKQPKLPKPKWDVCDINEWGPEEHQLGATIPEAGNSVYNETGGWRSDVPEFDPSKCDGCMLCYFYCPDASIIVECDKASGVNKAVGVDLAHCKGCGICANECPRKAIVMKIEEKG